MTRSTRTAVVQLCATPSVDDNIATAERLTRAARADGAEIVLLPEAFAFLGPESAKVRILEPLPDTADATGFSPGPILARCLTLARDLGIGRTSGEQARDIHLALAERIIGAGAGIGHLGR